MLLTTKSCLCLLCGVENDDSVRARHVHGVWVRSADYGIVGDSRNPKIQDPIHCVADVDGLTRYDRHLCCETGVIRQVLPLRV